MKQAFLDFFVRKWHCCSKSTGSGQPNDDDGNDSEEMNTIGYNQWGKLVNGTRDLSVLSVQLPVDL